MIPPSAPEFGAIRITFDIEAGRHTASPFETGTSSCSGVRPSDDGSILCVQAGARLRVVDTDRRLLIWQREAVRAFDVLGRLVATLEDPDAPPLPDQEPWHGQTVLWTRARPRRQMVTLFDADTGRAVSTTLPEPLHLVRAFTIVHAAHPVRLAITGDRRMWVVGADRADACLWRVEREFAVPDMDGFFPSLCRNGAANTVICRFREGGNTIAAVNLDDGSSRVARLANVPLYGSADCPLVSPDGRFLACQVRGANGFFASYAVADRSNRQLMFLPDAGPAMAGDAFGWASGTELVVPRMSGLELRALNAARDEERD